MNMIPPAFEYVVYKDNEKRLEQEIEWIRAAIENGTLVETKPWYAQIAGWLNTKVFNRAAARPVTVDHPCVELPC